MGISVRRAQVDDADAIAAVHYESWHAALGGSVPQPVLDEVPLADGQLRWHVRLSDRSGREVTFVAECDGELAGFLRLALPSRDRDADRDTAQIASLYVAPAHWRQGIGNALMTIALGSLPRAQWREVTLWALRISKPAQAFYASHGFRPDGATDVNERYAIEELRLRRPLQLGGSAGSERTERTERSSSDASR